MYYFTLCDFFYNYKVINFFIQQLRHNSEYFINSDICFNFYEGTYPYFYFNGEFNNNKGPTILTPSFKNKENISEKPIRFSMSNIFIEPNDVYNCYLNSLLKEFDKQGNYIEISNLDFLNYIDLNYTYNYILSNKLFLTLAPTIENINNLINSNNGIFSLIQLPEFYNLSEIKNLTHKNLLEIVINPNCFNCKDYQNCWLKENEYQINYSEKSNFLLCNKFKQILKSWKDIQEYYQLGINHFIIKSNPQHNSKDYLFLLIDFFIKDEYKYKILEAWSYYDELYYSRSL